MKSRRKIWSLPLAMVTALLLVGLLGAAVLAQANAAPVVQAEIEDQTITIGTEASTPASPISMDDAFSDADDADDALQYTAMSSAPRVASPSFAQAATVTTPGIVDDWWNALDGEDDLDCRKKAGRIGFSLTFDGDDLDTDPDNAPAVLAAPDATPPVTASDATGLCQDFTALAELDDDTTQNVDEGDIAQLMVVQAFHWDMLSGAEMVAAATAGGLNNPNAYGKAFADLSAAQRANVETLYTTKGVLARGSGTLTLTNDGIDADDDNAQLPDTATPDGAPGKSTITVKVSDETGRLIPPGDGRNTVGQTFKTTATLTPAPELDNLQADGSSGFFTAPTGSGNDVDFVTSALAGEGNDARVDVRISPSTTDIVNVNLGETVGPHQQAINFSLSNGGSPFQIKKTALDEAEIVVAPGETLTAAAPYSFTLTVNEYNNAPQNSSNIEIRVMVVVDNVAPTLINPPASASVAERARDEMLADFDASDPNNQVLTYRISGMDDNARDIMGGLDWDEDTGVLKTKDVVESPIDQPDYDETGTVDDPATTDVDETVAPDNEHVFVITVTDGTLTSAPHEFTLTVTDVDDPAPGSSQKLTVMEDNAGGVDNAFGFAPELGGGPADYSLGDQIDNQGNIAGVANPADVLFAVNADTGAVYLQVGKSVDFESGKVTYTLSISRGEANSGIVVVRVVDVNEGPEFSAVDKAREDAETDNVEGIALYVLESAAVGSVVSIGKDPGGGSPTTIPAIFTALDEDTVDAWNNIAYDLWYDDGTDTEDTERNDAYAGTGALFTVDSSGTIRVAQGLDTDADDAISGITLTLRAVDAGEQSDTDPMSELADTLNIRVEVIDTNVAPVFDLQSQGQTHTLLSEDTALDHVIFTYLATDEDGDLVKYRLRSEDDTGIFEIGELDGVLTLATPLDYETKTTHTVEVQAVDTDGDTDEVVLTVAVDNVNDKAPVFDSTPNKRINVVENTPRGTVLANYSATDEDGDTVTYELKEVGNNKSFQIDSATGDLMTLESLDYDSNTPCALAGCSVTVIATDGVHNALDGTSEPVVTIVVSPFEDSVGTLNVTKANPVPGTTMGNPMSALSNTKTTKSSAVPERPAGLPAIYGGAPMNFVDTDWANWGTVLRIEVTSQSPDANCGNGNQCVIVSVNSDSAGDTLKLQAYRMDTPAGAASNENKFVAAVMLVELDGEATERQRLLVTIFLCTSTRTAAFLRLQVDEEDEIEIEFGNLRGDVEVENEAPEISNFAPEHESAFDDADVDYTFTVTDTHSGLPEPEDLPDADGDDAYMPAVALISKGQCETADSDNSAESKKARAELMKGGFELVGDMANISDDESLYCPGDEQDGEYDASVLNAGYGFAPIRDDKDFDEIDDGFDVETTIVLRENKIFYVTFVACDNAGNCSFFDPDGNDDAEELAQITVDTEDPVFVEARTGLTWDSTDNEYDDNRSFIQVIFNDLTKLNTETVEIDDFVVEGHSIKDVHIFENPDDDDVDDWGRYGAAGHPNKRGIDRYRDIENSVFIELEDELLADETPDVTIVPNGVEDKAGNEQDDGDHEADDWISPKFTIVSIVSTRETSQDQILAGDDDEVTVVVTSDERLDSTRPTVTVTYVIAPSGSVDTKGVEDVRHRKGADKGTRERGEIE